MKLEDMLAAILTDLLKRNLNESWKLMHIEIGDKNRAVVAYLPSGAKFVIDVKETR